MQERYIQWLQHEIEIQTIYHNHKETMSWVVTALYIPSIIVAGYYVRDNAPELQSPCWFMLASSLVLAFIAVQFWYRYVSAKTIGALMELVNGLISGKIDIWELAGKGELGKGKVYWPKFVDSKMNEWGGFKSRSVIDYLFTDLVFVVAVVAATCIAITLAN